MITVKDIGRAIKAVEIGRISFVIHKEDLLREIKEKTNKLKNFEIESVSRKRIIFRHDPERRVYEIIDGHLNIIEKIPIEK